MKRSLLLWLLILGFAGTALQGVERLFSPSNATDFVLLQDVGLTWLFYLVVLAVTVLNAYAAWAYVNLKAMAAKAGIAAISAGVVESVMGYTIAVSNLERAKQIYAASRAARGLSVQEDAIAAIVSPSGMLTGLVISLLIPLVGIVMVLASRKSLNQ